MKNKHYILTYYCFLSFRLVIYLLPTYLYYNIYSKKLLLWTVEICGTSFFVLSQVEYYTDRREIDSIIYFFKNWEFIIFNHRRRYFC